MGSISYLNGTEEMPSYTTAKSGIVGLVNTMATILGKKNIRVNLIQPGWIMTSKQLEKWVDKKAEDLIDGNQLLHGKIYPDEPAKLVLFLASDQSGKITKQIINIDAGWI
jgi:NAD(P)-dependent dehydrogenase (short-subunit alcohol dehydrogenase family)